MAWLDAVLAFAITMLLFTIIVTMVVETHHRIFGSRERGLAVLLEDLFERDIWPRFQHRLIGLARAEQGRMTMDAATAKSEMSARFVTQMRQSRGSGLTYTDEEMAGKEFRGWPYRLLHRVWTSVFPDHPERDPVSGPKGSVMTRGVAPAGSAQLKKLEPDQFIERLADTAVGKAIEDEANSDSAATEEVLVNDLASRFDHAGDEARAYFLARARMWSIIYAFVVAFVFNVDAVRLLNTFVNDPSLAADVIKKKDAVVKAHEDQTKELEALLAKDNLAKEDADKIKDAADELKKLQAETEKTLKNLAPATLPVGLGYFPFCSYGGVQKDPACDGFTAVDKALTMATEESDRLTALKAQKETVKKLEAAAAKAWGAVWAEKDPEKRAAAEAEANKLGEPAAAARIKAEALAGPIVEADLLASLWHRVGFAFDNPRATAVWFLSVLLTGFLIGLGGPFWASTISRLSAVLGMVKATGLLKTDQSGAETAPKPGEKPATPTQIFRTARAAKNVSTHGGRMRLSADGRPARAGEIE